jgi:hypothetical protein
MVGWWQCLLLWLGSNVALWFCMMPSQPLPGCQRQQCLDAQCASCMSAQSVVHCSEQVLWTLHGVVHGLLRHARGVVMTVACSTPLLALAVICV